MENKLPEDDSQENDREQKPEDDEFSLFNLFSENEHESDEIVINSVLEQYLIDFSNFNNKFTSNQIIKFFETLQKILDEEAVAADLKPIFDAIGHDGQTQAELIREYFEAKQGSNNKPSQLRATNDSPPLFNRPQPLIQDQISP